MTIGSDGLPLITYVESAGSSYNLKSVKCGNYDCSLVNTHNVIDRGGFLVSSAIGVMAYLSLQIGIGLVRVISILKAVKCGSDRCLPYWTRKWNLKT